mmetsp:Transcript_7942/g.24885  ORF Transcript_7942/g.24885 Transcript_7942/m.24885 type:complete len:244 (-) Transcript_7942:299-1030(-)
MQGHGVGLPLLREHEDQRREEDPDPQGRRRDRRVVQRGGAGGDVRKGHRRDVHPVPRRALRREEMERLRRAPKLHRGGAADEDARRLVPEELQDDDPAAEVVGPVHRVHPSTEQIESEVLEHVGVDQHEVAALRRPRQLGPGRRQPRDERSLERRDREIKDEREADELDRQAGEPVVLGRAVEVGPRQHLGARVRVDERAQRPDREFCEELVRGPAGREAVGRAFDTRHAWSSGARLVDAARA